MIECPWCHNEVNIVNGRCEECKKRLYEVNENDFAEIEQEDNTKPDYDMDVEEIILNNFKCSICKCDECSIKEVAVTGTGLSKLFDIEHNHYLFVSCENCGKVEIYNPDILRGKKSGKIGTIMDILFGG